MATLDTFFVLRRPVKHRVTLLEDSYDVHIFSRVTDCYPAPDGTFRRERKDYTRDDIPLLGSYFVEELDEDGDRTGRFEVLTPEEFADKLSEHREPSRQYGEYEQGERVVHATKGTGTIYQDQAGFKNAMVEFDSEPNVVIGVRAGDLNRL
jgi:hypothetical protein